MGQSDNLIIVLGLCLLGYWSYCLVWGFKGFRSSKTAQDYFIAGRDLSFWVFVLAVTATSFSGWTFMSHPGVIFQNGLQSAYASFYAIMIPFTGVLFLKRQWMLGKWKGYITPGDMFYDYFRISAIKPLVALVAVLFSVIYISIQLQASGYLFEVLVGWPMWKGMLVLSIVLGFYVILGGLRAVASVDTMQGVLLVFGMVVLGLFVLGKVGNLPQGIIELLEFDYIRITDNQYSHYAAVPTTLFEKEPPGGQWTAIFILTFMFAMMGIQASPAFTMWAFSSESPKPFGVQQVFASSLVVGGIMFTFTVIQGLGAHLLGADGDLNTYADLSAWKALFKEPIIQSDTLIPELISLMKQPLLTSLLAICALAAMQSTAASYITTTSAILTRDVFKRSTEQHRPVVWGRLFAIVIVTLSIVIAWNVRSNNLASLGGLAVAYGLQMVPALVAICWWPWLTGTGVAVGLVTGILAVTLTDALGGYFPWGKYPFTIHSAGWGILFNFTLVISVSALNRSNLSHRLKFHDFFKQHAEFPEAKKTWKPLVLVFVLVWFFFAIGPGTIFGNSNWLFGTPNDPATWRFNIIPLWGWQILWWGLGVLMMWILAYKMEMSTAPNKEVLSEFHSVAGK